MIYTSGSTGGPRASMVAAPRAGATWSWTQAQAFAIGPKSRVLQFASFGFDACVLRVADGVVPRRASLLRRAARTRC